MKILKYILNQSGLDIMAKMNACYNENSILCDCGLIIDIEPCECGIHDDEDWDFIEFALKNLRQGITTHNVIQTMSCCDYTPVEDEIAEICSVISSMRLTSSSKFAYVDVVLRRQVILPKSWFHVNNETEIIEYEIPYQDIIYGFQLKYYAHNIVKKIKYEKIGSDKDQFYDCGGITSDGYFAFHKGGAIIRNSICIILYCNRLELDKYQQSLKNMSRHQPIIVKTGTIIDPDLCRLISYMQKNEF